MLLTSRQPDAKQLPRRRAPEFLGVLLWSEVEQRLKDLTPVDVGAAERWSAVLQEAFELAGRSGVMLSPDS